MKQFLVIGATLLMIFMALLGLAYRKNNILLKEIDDLKGTNTKYQESLNKYKEELIKSKGNEKNRQGSYSIEEIKKIDLTGINKIMISTHPDDEMFWGGGHLLKDNYLVVCVTCGMDADRQRDFEKSMKETNDKYVMLEYPRSVDPSLVREFNWNAAAYLTQDLQNILALKDWDEIVTHNPEGEYGHKYHRLTSQVVTALVKDKKKLYYFGKFYRVGETYKLSKDVLDEETYKKKVNIINNNYKSQYKSAEINSHMFRNENFVKYADWK